MNRLQLQFQTLTEAQYAALDADELFPGFPVSWCHGVIVADDRAFKLSWQSDLLTPVVLPVAETVFLVGIDTAVAVASVTHGVLLFCELPDFLVEGFVHNGFAFIATELSVWKLAITAQAATIVTTYALPDLYESRRLEQGGLVIGCQDGSQLRID